MKFMTAQEMVSSLYRGGLTDKGIADETGVSQPTITRIRNGLHADPKHATWARILKAYSRSQSRAERKASHKARPT